MRNMTIVGFLKDRATRNADDLAFRFLGNGELDGPKALAVLHEQRSPKVA